MQIEYLCDNIVFSEVVANWIYNEFIKDIRHGVSYDQILKSVRKCYKSELPIRLVAVEANRCIGTVSIVQNDLKSRSYTPWLAALYVDESCRGKKVGEQLIERVKEVVKELGYDELYLRTEHTSEYYLRLGWQFVESCDDEFNLKPSVFKFTLI